MKDGELAELQNPGNWDFGKAQRYAPKAKRRAIVSVAFSRAQFEQVCDFAEGARLKVSQFIRRAALRRNAGARLSGAWDTGQDSTSA